MQSWGRQANLIAWGATPLCLCPLQLFPWEAWSRRGQGHHILYPHTQLPSDFKRVEWAALGPAGRDVEQSRALFTKNTMWREYHKSSHLMALQEPKALSSKWRSYWRAWQSNLRSLYEMHLHSLGRCSKYIFHLPALILTIVFLLPLASLAWSHATVPQFCCFTEVPNIFTGTMGYVKAYLLSLHLLTRFILIFPLILLFISYYLLDFSWNKDKRISGTRFLLEQSRQLKGSNQNYACPEPPKSGRHLCGRYLARTRLYWVPLQQGWHRTSES